MQLLPNCPHTVVVVPGWQTPLPSQQPLLQGPPSGAHVTDPPSDAGPPEELNAPELLPEPLPPPPASSSVPESEAPPLELASDPPLEPVPEELPPEDGVPVSKAPEPLPEELPIPESSDASPPLLPELEMEIPAPSALASPLVLASPATRRSPNPKTSAQAGTKIRIAQITSCTRALRVTRSLSPEALRRRCRRSGSRTNRAAL
jgi:hypothetical protein